MKNVTRNKLFLCFRPLVVEVELKPDGVVDCSTSDKVFTYISLENREDDRKISTMKTSSLSDKGFAYITIENKEDDPKISTKKMPSFSNENFSKIEEEQSDHRRPLKRIYSRIVKAIVFQASLSKKPRDQKIHQDSFRSNPGKRFSDVKTVNQKSFREIKPNSVISPSSSSSSSFRRISESNISNSFRSNSIKQEQNVKNQRKTFNCGIHLLLISLTLTILLGRLWAILLTSIWLYFLHRRHFENVARRSTEKFTKWPEMETESFRDYKKRVIMEGLLERNHQQKGH